MASADYITKPRIEAAITGKTPNGEPIEGDYKFTDEFPMAEGFEENAEFFTLTYETPVAVGHNLAFARIAAAAVDAGGQSVADASTPCPRRLGGGGYLRRADRSGPGDAVLQGGGQGGRLCGSPTSSPTMTGASRRLPGACRTQWSLCGCTSRTCPISASRTGTEAMKFTLKDYQDEAVRDVLVNLRKAAKRWHEDGDRHAFSLTATTGAGKTVMAAAVFEALFHGDDDFDFEADPGAVVIWFTDDPALNEQTRFRLLRGV